MDLIQFDAGSGERIARVVRFVEQLSPSAAPLTFSSVIPSGRRSFRVATFAGEWAKAATKTVTLRGSTSTLSAVNLFAEIASSAADRNCAIARDGTAWYLIAAEC